MTDVEWITWNNLIIDFKDLLNEDLKDHLLLMTDLIKRLPMKPKGGLGGWKNTHVASWKMAEKWPVDTSKMRSSVPRE